MKRDRQARRKPAFLAAASLLLPLCLWLFPESACAQNAISTGTRAGFRMYSPNGNDWWLDPSKGNFDIRVNGLPAAVTLNALGNLGIGTTSPASNLHIKAPGTSVLLESTTPGAGDEILSSPPAGSTRWGIGNLTGTNFQIATGVSPALAVGLTMDSLQRVGIGTGSPGALLSVGGSNQFQVDSSGNLVKIKNVAYSWPASQATAGGQVLTNDGAGNLNWAASAPTGVAGNILQVKNFQTGASATGTGVIPLDDTIPQNTEGNEYMTLTITPTSATNNLKIEVVWNGMSNGSVRMTVALFRDSTASALATASSTNDISMPANIKFAHFVAAGSTSATTFKVRAGGSVAGTTTFNGATSSGGRLFGGTMASSITITESMP